MSNEYTQQDDKPSSPKTAPIGQPWHDELHEIRLMQIGGALKPNNQGSHRDQGGGAPKNDNDDQDHAPKPNNLEEMKPGENKRLGVIEQIRDFGQININPLGGNGGPNQGNIGWIGDKKDIVERQNAMTAAERKMLELDPYSYSRMLARDKKPSQSLSEEARNNLHTKIEQDKAQVLKFESKLLEAGKKLSVPELAQLASTYDRISGAHAKLGDDKEKANYAEQSGKLWRSIAENCYFNDNAITSALEPSIGKQLAQRNPAIAAAEAKRASDFKAAAARSTSPANKDGYLEQAKTYDYRCLDSLTVYDQLTGSEHPTEIGAAHLDFAETAFAQFQNNPTHNQYFGEALSHLGSALDNLGSTSSPSVSNTRERIAQLNTKLDPHKKDYLDQLKEEQIAELLEQLPRHRRITPEEAEKAFKHLTNSDRRSIKTRNKPL